MPDDDAERLPRNVEPERYEITLAPDLEAFSFDGRVVVQLQVREPTSTIELHAVELDLHRAEVVAADGDGGRHAPAIALDGDSERAVLTLDGELAPGPATLSVDFSGTLNDKLRGFYRSVYEDDDGRSHTIATTQFEPTDARRAFPCWDEPDRKATFAVTLEVPAELTAISNGDVVERTDTGDGRHRVRFAETMPMSTYLVAFVVGPLVLTDPLDVDGVPLRVACVPGKEDLAEFGLDVAAHSLRFFGRYFDIPYPSDKLDLIALPDFAMGAMENLGAVTFRETALLVDPVRATRVELERVADVVAHEIAHMWFGDLVTMRWWNGIWLNEAFATFMELLCVDDFRPDWERWVTFGLSRGNALLVDGLASTRPVEYPVRRPEEAEGMFDVLTYQKGAAVVRMLERYVGGEPFRRGIARYIAAHSYANTETTDLWDAVEQATGEPARAVMDSWIFQGGHPLVSVEATPDRTGVVVSQGRFRYLDVEGDGAEPHWQVPVQLRAEVDGEVVRRNVLLDTGRAEVDLGGEPAWVVVNDGGWGFYRVRYDSELLAALTAALDRLDALERYNLVSDTWAAVLAGRAPVDDVVSLARLLGGETDPNVWTAVLGALGFLDRMLDPAERPRLQRFVRALVRPAFERLGWSPGPLEKPTTRTLRATLVQALGGLGADDEVRAKARALHAQHLEAPGTVDADVAGAVVNVVAVAGGPDDYATFLERYRAAATPQEEQRYLYALGAFEHVELVERTMDLALSGDVRAQNVPFLVSRLVANREGGERAWRLVERHWDELTARLPETLHDRMLEGITTLSTPELAADVHEFLAAHPIPGHQRTVDQLLERLDIAVAFRRREAAGLPAAFDDGADGDDGA